MGIREDVKKKGLELLGDPRVIKLLQNEQFTRAMTALFQVSGKVHTFTAEQSERFARTMQLATHQELAELQRTVRELQRQVTRLEQKLGERDR